MPDNDVLPRPAIHGRWKKGQSGNPKGRPSQAPFKAAMALLRAASGTAALQAATKAKEDDAET